MVLLTVPYYEYRYSVIVPDVNVSGASANPGMIDGMLGLMLRQQTQTKQTSV